LLLLLSSYSAYQKCGKILIRWATSEQSCVEIFKKINMPKAKKNLSKQRRSLSHSCSVGAKNSVGYYLYILEIINAKNLCQLQEHHRLLIGLLVVCGWW
jgi:hypothetical protein